jgi:glutathione S-transferase
MAAADEATPYSKLQDAARWASADRFECCRSQILCQVTRQGTTAIPPARRGRTLRPMLLYHFPFSPFARRVRLTLAHKGLSAELRDARAEPRYLEEVRRLNPMHTVPVLVDAERVVVDSTAICEYLDRKVPSPPLWPAGLAGAEAHELTALTSSAITILVDLGARYHATHDHPRAAALREEYVGRAQRALDQVAARVAARGEGPLCGDAWSMADIAVYTTVAWLEGLPLRAPQVPAAQQVVELGWSLPPALTKWASWPRQRTDVRTLGTP